MDFTVGWLTKAGISSGLEGLLGRWVLGFSRGQFIIDGHQERLIPSTELEDRVAKVFHFLVGGGGVALGYPLVLAISPGLNIGNPFLGGFTYGVATLLVAWFIQYPPFHFGVCGFKAPAGSRPIAASVTMHVAYGLGLGLVLQITAL